MKIKVKEANTRFHCDLCLDVMYQGTYNVVVGWRGMITTCFSCGTKMVADLNVDITDFSKLANLMEVMNFQD